ncbi:hypothetical protein A0257_19525 [Hymenobacter psoromatis]|nr:hypothetical protein A0257_19525 [Hymenobacter psoromatis]
MVGLAMAAATVMVVATTGHATMLRARLSCSPFTGVAGTAAVSAAATAYVVVVATAVMGVVTVVATTVAGAAGSNILFLIFK